MSGNRPTFSGFLKASGKAEIWTNTEGNNCQPPWQLLNTYTSDTLIGNWNEERFDVKELSQTKCLPSQYDHYFETTYRQGYSKSLPGVPEVLKYSQG